MLTSRGLNIQDCKKVNDVLVKQLPLNVNVGQMRCTPEGRVIGMSNSIVQSALEKTVCKVVQHIGADICEEKIKSYHRLNKKRQSEIREISRRKDCEQVMKVKKDLKDLSPSDLGFT